VLESFPRSNRNDPMNILIIGGTGFLGQRLVRQLHRAGEKIYLCVRLQSLAKARSLFQDLPGIVYVKGDIEHTDLLTDVGQAEEISEKIDCLVHLAASYQLDIKSSSAYLQNVLGTQNVIRLISRLTKLKYFHYFSTYAVNQLVHGRILESELMDANAPFFDQYAKSKNNAEHLVRELVPQHIRTVIHRPGIIVGDSQTGSRDKDDGPYYFFNFIVQTKRLGPLTKKIKFLPLPVQNDSLMPVLPVDILIDWSSQIILSPKDRPLSCYHLIPKTLIRTKDYLQLSIDLLDSPLKIICTPVDQVFPPLFKLLGLPQELVFYMKQQAYLDRANLNADYPHFQEPDYRSYLPKIIETFLEDRA
jgi:thioester reductase-like protein